MKVAVIGGGAAGLTAAWALSKHHDVTLYEAEKRLGGHANTIDVDCAGAVIPVDTGFIVYNEANYPQFKRLLAALDVPTQRSVMTFSVSIDKPDLEYAGNARGLFCQPANAWRPAFWRLLGDIKRFNRDAMAFLDGDQVPADLTLGQFLERQGYGPQLAEQYLLPMAAAIWSASISGMRDFPARSILRFFANHGLLRLRNRPLWRTVAGGSRSYVERLRLDMSAHIRTGSTVLAVRRLPTGVRLAAKGGLWSSYDHVVFATHADDTLRLLGADATSAERRFLGAFRYQANRAILHRDVTLMPRRRGAWSSWNYLAKGQADDAKVAVTYWMNRLQNLPAKSPVLVTLNPIDEPAPQSVVREFSYMHPQFDGAAIAAQGRLPTVQGVRRSWFCGAYCGNGFHEDAVQSGLAVAAALGAPAPWYAGTVPASPAAAIIDPSLAIAAE
ncbi:MAG: NAD(P)/FAD-dependent oxidoreductase [Dongiaceae bacterium]